MNYPWHDNKSWKKPTVKLDESHTNYCQKEALIKPFSLSHENGQKSQEWKMNREPTLKECFEIMAQLEKRIEQLELELRKQHTFNDILKDAIKAQMTLLRETIQHG